QQPAAGEAAEVVGGEGRGVGSPGTGPRAGRLRALDGHGGKCGTGPGGSRRADDHPPAFAVVVSAGASGARRPGVVIASVATRRKSTTWSSGRLIVPNESRLGVVSEIRTATTRSGWPCC